MYTPLTEILAASLMGTDAWSALMVTLVALAFTTTWGLNRLSLRRIRHRADQGREISAIMQHTLDISDSYVLRLDLRQQRAHNLHGTLLPPEGLGFEESFARIHPDDRQTYRDFVVAMHVGRQDKAECIFRWDISGERREGQWRYMHDQGVVEYSDSGRKTPANIFCTLSDCTDRIVQEQEQQELTDRYRMIFDQSIVGLAFYDCDGRLLTANRKMREILNFQSEADPYYYNNTVYDMPAFRDVLTNRRAEELYFCTKSVVVERGVNCYTELRLHPISDEEGRLVYITLAIRDVTQERELYLQNKVNDAEIRRANDEIQQYETELQYLMEQCDMRFWRTSFKDRTITFYKGLTTAGQQLSFDEFQQKFIDDDGTIARNFANPEEHFKEPVAYLCHTRPIYHDTDQLQWNIIDNVPYYDEQGRLTGCYGVIRNVTDLIEKQERLKQETERANDSGRLKSVFMANMTHEIRTPLNSIVGFSDVLPMLTSPEEKKEIVRVIMNNCDMLLRLINDILAISSLDAGGIKLEPHDTDFAKDFDDICESLQERVQTPGVEFIKDNPYTTCQAHVDTGRIQQVVTNFVTNAVKYTHQGHIRVGYRREEEPEGRQSLYVYCEDTGEGIPKEHQSRIFDRFVKLNDYIQGTGLGLSICRAIADACHGEVGVDSEGKGHGSTFWLRIPLMLLALLSLWLPMPSMAQGDTATAQATTTTDSIPAPPTLRNDVDYTPEHPLVYEDAWDLWPYAYLNDSGDPVGYNIDLLRLILGRLDIPYIIRLRPNSQALQDLRNGQADLMLGMDARFNHGNASYGKSVVQLFTHSVLHHKDHPTGVKTEEDLARQQVVVHKGSFSHNLMIEHGWGNNAEPSEDMQESVLKAHNDPNAQVLWNTMSLKWLVNHFGYDELEISPVDMEHGEYKFMSNNPRLLAMVDSVYNELRSTEQLVPIQNKWFYPERQETGIPSWVWHLAVTLGLLAVLVLALYIWYQLRERRLTRSLRRNNARLALILKTSGVRFWTYNTLTKTFTWMDNHGKPLRDYTVQEFSKRYRKEDFMQLVQAINEVARREKQKVTLEMRAKEGGDSGEDRDFVIAISVLRTDRDGRPNVIIGSRSDITEERQEQLRAQDTMLRYQTIFNTAMVDMVFYDKEGYITNMNERACQTFKMDLEETRRERVNVTTVINEPDMHFDLQNMDVYHCTEFLNTKTENRNIKSRKLKDEMCYEVQLVPLYDDNHQLLGIFGSGRDVSEVARTYNKVRESIRQMQTANNRMTQYISNIDNVLNVGGIRMVNYSPETHTLTIYSRIGHAEHTLTQTRALTLVDETSRKKARRMLNSMDNRTTQPLEDTIMTTLRIAGGKRLYLQVSFIPTYDERGRLNGYFGMSRDVSELKTTEAELAKNTAKAQEVETVKDAFLHNMSYEIRTPLNTVVGFAELFQQEHASEDEPVFIEEIKTSSAKLLKLINNILFLSRLDAGMIEFNTKTTDLAQAFEVSCRMGWSTIQQPGVEYIVENPYSQFVADIDSLHLDLIINHLTANAAQHTTSGHVRARYDLIGDQLVVSVSDTGSGIAPDRLDTIFERFASGGESGSGLGLSICHELTRQLGGTIKIKSTVGRGTTVWVSIPCKPIEYQSK